MKLVLGKEQRNVEIGFGNQEESEDIVTITLDLDLVEALLGCCNVDDVALALSHYSALIFA